MNNTPPCEICGNAFKIDDEWKCFCNCDIKIAQAIRKEMSTERYGKIPIKDLIKYEK